MTTHKQMLVDNSVMNQFIMAKGIESTITKTIQELVGSLPHINHRSIRRAVARLIESGMLFELGRKGNAILYGTELASKKIDANMFRFVYKGNNVELGTFLRELLADDLVGIDGKKVIVKMALNSIDRGFDSSILENKELFRQAEQNLLYKIKRMRELLASPLFNLNTIEHVGDELKKLAKKNPQLVQEFRDFAA